MISGGDRPRMAGESDIVAVPAMADQRRDRRPVGIAEISGEKGPDVIAAQYLARLDETQPQLRARSGERKRDQPAGEAAADDRHVAV